MGNQVAHIVYIEGNIGAGKSELLERLETKGYKVVKEAIEEDWTLFEKAKADPKRWCTPFQLQVSISIAERIEAAIHGHKGPWPIIVERSIVSAYLFARVANRCDNLTTTELDIIRKFSLMLNQRFDGYFTHTIMLECPVDVCLKRTKKRGRPGEEKTTTDYLKMVETEYANAKESNWDTVDGSQTPEQVLEDVLKMCQ